MNGVYNLPSQYILLDGQNMLKVDFILKQNKDPRREI